MPGSNGPLSGCRVIELGSTVAGPFCGRMLADFGAEVIKVEDPDGDLVRSMGKRYHGKSLYAASIFRNKLAISLNLRDERGREIARRLAGDADILIENFRPGRMEQWGLGYDDLREANPGLIMVRISGYGQDGPYAHRPGFGVIGEAMSGLRHITGDPDRPPARVAVSLTDYMAGLYGALGALLALIAREKDGVGQLVDTALYEGAFSLMEPWIPAYEKLGHVANRSGSRLPESTPNNLYPTADQQFIHITAPGDGLFRRLVEIMGRPELADDMRFADAVSRSENQPELDDSIAKWTATLVLEELERTLEEAGVPASRIFTMADIFGDPHYRARDSIISVPDDDLGTVKMAAVVPRLSRTPGRVGFAGRRIGQDTRDVLEKQLGFTPSEIDLLCADGVIGRQPEPAE